MIKTKKIKFMKKETPIRRIRHTLNEIKLSLKDNFEIIELDKKKPQSNYILGIHSPGIKDDYTLIFKSLKSGRSFAFAMNYQAQDGSILPESKWRFIATIKDKEYQPKDRTKSNFIEEQKSRNKERNVSNRSKISSKQMHFVDFKIILKELAKNISETELNSDDIFKLVHVKFNIDDLQRAKGVKKNKIKDFIDKKTEELQLIKLEESIKKESLIYNEKMEEIKEEYVSLDSYIELKEMEEKIKVLREKVQSDKKNLFASHHIHSTRSKIVRMKNKIKDNELKLKEDVMQETKGISESMETSIEVYLESNSKKRKSGLKL